MNTNDMVRGLVRLAELRERDSGGDLWDDESREALAEARRRGWGSGRTGSLNGSAFHIVLDDCEGDPAPFAPGGPRD